MNRPKGETGVKRKHVLRYVIFAAVILAVAGLWFLLSADREKPEYILLMNGIKMGRDEELFQAFEETIREHGGEPLVLELSGNEEASIEQNRLLKKNISRRTACIIADGVCSV